MAASYTGKVLTVDLGSGKIEAESVPDEVYERFIGGLGLGAWWLYTRMPAGADPLGSEAILGFVPGLLTGSGSLFTGRWMAVCKSPLTGGWGDANCGGTLAPAIKRCGYDAVFVRGVSEKPVYLEIGNSGAVLRDATALWGLDAIETEAALVAGFAAAGGKKRPSVAAIGPAGENRSLISGIVTDGGRIAARSGVGAVMGSKRLKALVVAGSKPIPCADRAAVKANSLAFAKSVHAFPLPPTGLLRLGGVLLRKLPWNLRFDGFLFGAVLGRLGTAGMNRLSVEWGDAPLKNWKGSERDYPARRSRAIDPARVLERQERAYHCYSCPTGCGGLCRVAGRETHKPEYETVLALSGLLLCDDLEAVFRMNDAMNRAGVDTISAGASIAMAIELAESGALPKDALGDLDLRWGSAAGAEGLLRLMIAREGLGAIFADGVRQTALRLGPAGGKPAAASRGAAGPGATGPRAAGPDIDGPGAAARDAAGHAGGQELAMHDPRNDPGFALHAAVDPAPGKHTVGCRLYYGMFRLWTRVPGAPKPPLLERKDRAFETGPEAARAAVLSSDFISLFNGAGLCLFGSLYGADRLRFFETLDAATGWRRSPADYLEAGRRIQTLRQLFSLREGIEPKDVVPAARALGRPPKEAGANRGRSVPLEALARGYWEEIGWPEGRPSSATLARLGLAELEARHGR